MDKNTLSLDTILAKTEDIAKKLSESGRTVSGIGAYTRSGQWVGVITEREGFKLLQELESIDQSKKEDEKLLAAGYKRGYHDVADFLKWSAESQSVVYISCLNRIASKIEGTKIQQEKWDTASSKWKYAPVIRKYPIDFHYKCLGLNPDDDVEGFVRVTLKLKKDSP